MFNFFPKEQHTILYWEGAVRGIQGVPLRPTHIAVVDPNTVPVVEPLEGAREVDVEIEVVSVLRFVNSRQICEKVFVNILREWLGGTNLVVHGGVKRQGLADYFDDLPNRFV